MTLVHRFTLPDAVKTERDVFLSGLGFFAAGVFDVPLSNTSLIVALQSTLGVSDLGQVDNSVTPAPGQIAATDPFPQYLTISEITDSVETGSDSFATALRSSSITVVNAGTNLSAARPAGASTVLWKFSFGVSTGSNGSAIVHGQPGDLVFVASS